MNIEAFWQAVLDQDAQALARFFAPGAEVRWHCTNERFTAAEYIPANCEYPGKWAGEIVRIERCGETIITALRVYSRDGSASFHVTSFFRLEGEKIAAVDEYWADDGPAPRWRQELKIGRPIYPQKINAKVTPRSQMLYNPMLHCLCGGVCTDERQALYSAGGR